MFILVSGADTFRSLQKAHELEQAYRAKHDPSGFSVQRFPSGKDGIDPLLSSMSGGSLFSARRFLRADGAVSECPKAKRDALLRALARDADDMIVVCVESSDLTEAECKPFAKLPKFFHYRFPLLSPAAFLDWAIAYASSLGVKASH
jgi:DNA polymerase III delta subunit